MPQLAIVIPVYNEGENLGMTLDAIENSVRTPHEIYIVYDFDEDNSIPVAQRFMERGVPIKMIRNDAAGVANAIKLGLRSVEGDYVLVAMGDLSDDFLKVDIMCNLMSQGYDLVCGSRYIQGGKQVGGPLVKKTLSRLAGLSLRYFTGLPTSDPTNSFKLYRKSMIDRFDLESTGGFEVGLELTVKAYSAGYNIAEVPCTWKDRQEGTSKFKLFKWLPYYLRWYLFALRRPAVRHGSRSQEP